MKKAMLVMVALLVGAILVAGCASENDQYEEGEVPCNELAGNQASGTTTEAPLIPTALVFQRGGGGGSSSAASGGARGGGASSAGNSAGAGGGRSSSSPSPGRSSSGFSSSSKPVPPSKISSSSSSSSYTPGFYGSYPVFFYGDADDGDEDGNCIVQYVEED